MCCKIQTSVYFDFDERQWHTIFYKNQFDDLWTALLNKDFNYICNNFGFKCKQSQLVLAEGRRVNNGKNHYW